MTCGVTFLVTFFVGEFLPAANRRIVVISEFETPQRTQVFVSRDGMMHKLGVIRIGKSNRSQRLEHHGSAHVRLLGNAAHRNIAHNSYEDNCYRMQCGKSIGVPAMDNRSSLRSVDNPDSHSTQPNRVSSNPTHNHVHGRTVDNPDGHSPRPIRVSADPMHTHFHGRIVNNRDVHSQQPMQVLADPIHSCSRGRSGGS